jgi:hypothetical protein
MREEFRRLIGETFRNRRLSKGVVTLPVHDSALSMHWP